MSITRVIASEQNLLRKTMSVLAVLSIGLLAHSITPVFVQAQGDFIDLGTLGGSSSSPNAVSADGSVVIGFADTAGDVGQHAFRWTQTGGMTDLGTLGGTQSRARALSADGSVVVGNSNLAGDLVYRAFRWTEAGGMLDLGTLGGTYSEGRAVSADGVVVVGSAYTTGNAGERAFRWTQAGGMTDLGTLGAASMANAVNADGSVVAGMSYLAGNASLHAFRWTEVGGMSDLGTLGGSYSQALAISADGAVVAGDSHIAGNSSLRAFRWTEATGMQDLGTIGGLNSNANGLSADGTTVVGRSYTAFEADFHGFRWTEAGGMSDLGTLGGTMSDALAVSADGSVVVGWASGPGDVLFQAFRWTESDGMQSVEGWLEANGVDVAPGLLTNSANAVSGDGSVVVGYLWNNHAYLARVSPAGSGLIDPAVFNRTLQGAAYVPVQVVGEADLILNGLHGTPMRGRPSTGRGNLWVSGDWARQENVPGDGDIGAGQIGGSWGVAPGVTGKRAVGRSYSGQTLAFAGNAANRGTYIVPELIMDRPNSPLTFSLSGYFNDGSAEIRRGYINAGTPVSSKGSADSRTNGLRLRLDARDILTYDNFRVTPYISTTHFRTRIDSYTETGGGFPVHWDARTENSTLGRLGVDATHELSRDWTLLGRLEGVHRFDPSSTNATGEIIGLSAFDFEGFTYKRDWLRVGFGGESRLGRGFATVMLNSSTETNGPTHWIYASYRLDF